VKTALMLEIKLYLRNYGKPFQEQGYVLVNILKMQQEKPVIQNQNSF
jgi:hypothetical protein